MGNNKIINIKQLIKKYCPLIFLKKWHFPQFFLSKASKNIYQLTD